MKRILRLLVLSGLLVIWIPSCKGINVNMPIPSLTPDIQSNEWKSWLIEPVCQLPCWQYITPGVTTLKEAVSILEDSPDVKIRYRTNNGVDWKFTLNKNEGGEIRASEDGIVRSITLGGDSEILLQTIIASYGDPKYVKTYDCRYEMCSTFLIYPDLGMLVSIFLKNATGNDVAPQIEISPTTLSDSVIFMKSGMENVQKEISLFQDYHLAMDWKGYGEYP